MAVKSVQAIINGQTYALTLNNSNGKYESTITAPANSSYSQVGHYYDIQVKASDEAGNITTINSSDETLGNKLQLVVKEKVAPVIAITSPTAGALMINNKPTITWNITDNDSGVNSGSIGITIDSGVKITSGITKTEIAGGYQCSYTPATALTDGSHIIKVDGIDNDGNASTQKTVSFKIDTVPPSLSVTTPVNSLITNQVACTVSGTTNDATSSPVTLTIKLNSGPDQLVTVNDNGSFNKSLTLVPGSNTIMVVATDGAGKTTTVTRSVILDTVAPVITGITITPNPVDAGKTFVITVNVTDV